MDRRYRGNISPVSTTRTSTLAPSDMLLLFGDGNEKCIVTGRHNQDALENLFPTIRGRRYRINPDATQFRSAFRQVLVDSLMLKSDGANGKDDLDS